MQCEKPLDLLWKAEVLPSGFGKCSRFVRSGPVALTRAITVPAGGHVSSIVAVHHHRACLLSRSRQCPQFLNEIAESCRAAPICNVTPRGYANETKRLLIKRSYVSQLLFHTRQDENHWKSNTLIRWWSFVGTNRTFIKDRVDTIEDFEHTLWSWFMTLQYILYYNMNFDHLYSVHELNTERIEKDYISSKIYKIIKRRTQWKTIIRKNNVAS